MRTDNQDYFEFTSKARLDKSINTLVGIVEGISIDGKINKQEVSFLTNWIREHDDVRHQHPYNELLPLVAHALEDGVLSPSEREDIHWLCNRLRSTEYYTNTTADLQRLHAIVAGISSDGIVTPDELTHLAEWIAEHDDLRTCYPYDEIDSLITSTLADHHIDPQEHARLLAFFQDFADTGEHQVIERVATPEPITIIGVCAVCPEIYLPGALVCFTGASERYTRDEFSRHVTQRGAKVTNSVSKKLSYLVIGADGNPCWAYACYGRKVESAVNLRKQGHHIMIVHEHDFHEALA